MRLSLALLLIFPCSSFAQMNVQPSGQISVSDLNGVEILNPWTGGLNAVELSTFDADLDGENDDLFIFDKAGDRILVFETIDNNGLREFKHRPEHSLSFPVLRQWALLRDFNCDGKKDIFTYGPSGGVMAVYENISSPTSGIGFELVTNSLRSYFPLGAFPANIGIYVSSQDIPAIFDFDGDGDLDVMSFGVSGSMVELHLNQTFENFGTCGLDTLVLANRCYGKFAEGSESNGIITDPDVLASICSFNVSNPKSNGKDGRHVGSTILAFDANQDGLAEIILGDVTYRNMTYITIDDRNGVLPDSADYIATDFPFDLGGIPVDIDNFPAGFYEDLTGDGVRDLVIGVNNSNVAENKRSVWYYENLGLDDLPIFSFVQDNLLQDQTIDYGEGSSISLTDIDGDGLRDMIIGSRGLYQSGGDYVPTLSYYRNTGTANQPSYQLMDDNYLDITSLELGQYLHTAFGDINGDGNAELIIGDATGAVYLFNNSSAPGQLAAYTLSGALTATDGAIDVGQNAAPTLFDIDQDGLLDLIIGERNGNLNYYRNEGSTTSPSFALITDTLGGVSTVEFGFFVGNSSPNFYRFNGETFLAAGGQAGNIRHYGGIDGNLDVDFFLINANGFGIDVGLSSKPVVSDVNGDGIPDILSGGIGGGVSLFMGDFLTSLRDAEWARTKIVASPNPTGGMIRISGADFNTGNTGFSVHSLDGRLMLKGSLADYGLDLSGLANGTYIISLVEGEKLYYTKVVKQ